MRQFCFQTAKFAGLPAALRQVALHSLISLKHKSCLGRSLGQRQIQVTAPGFSLLPVLLPSGLLEMDPFSSNHLQKFSQETDLCSQNQLLVSPASGQVSSGSGQRVAGQEDGRRADLVMAEDFPATSNAFHHLGRQETGEWGPLNKPTRLMKSPSDQKYS